MTFQPIPLYSGGTYAYLRRKVRVLRATVVLLALLNCALAALLYFR